MLLTRLRQRLRADISNWDSLDWYEQIPILWRLPMVEYERAWVADIDDGLAAWPRLSYDLSLALHPAAGGVPDLARAASLCQDYVSRHLLSMLGFPDFVGALTDITGDITRAITNHLSAVFRSLGIPDFQTVMNRMTGDLLGSLLSQAFGVSASDALSMLTDPLTKLEQVCDTLTGPGKGVHPTEFLVDVLHVGSTGSFDPEQFAPAWNALVMAKLALMSQKGINDLMVALGSDKRLAEPNAMLGYLDRLDVSDAWLQGNEMVVARDPAAYRQILLPQPGARDADEMAVAGQLIPAERSFHPGAGTTFHAPGDDYSHPERYAWTLGRPGWIVLGSIDQTGRFTAPDDFMGDYTSLVRAVRKSDGKEFAASYRLIARLHITPDRVEMGPGATQRFTPIPNVPVTWSISNGDGSITPDGVYHAPDEIPGTHTIWVFADDVGGGRRGGAAEVTLRAPLAISPSGTVLAPGQTRQFHGPPGEAVTWEVLGEGTVSMDGLYQAPSAVAQPHDVTLRGTVASRAAVGTAVIHLVPLGIVPNGVYASEGTIQQFVPIPAVPVTWALDGPGTLSATGEYKAPDVIDREGTIATIRATSSSGFTATAPVILRPRLPVVPAEVTLTAGQSQAFLSSPGVTWSLNGPGSVSQEGVYQAPATLSADQTALVVAMNATRSGRGVVTLRALKVTADRASVPAGGTAQLRVDPAVPVTWTVVGGGSVTPSGLYTAPTDVLKDGEVTLTATAEGEPQRTGSITLSLWSPLRISPNTVTVKAGGAQTFSVDPDVAMTWDAGGGPPGGYMGDGQGGKSPERAALQAELDTYQTAVFEMRKATVLGTPEAKLLASSALESFISQQKPWIDAVQAQIREIDNTYHAPPILARTTTFTLKGTGQGRQGFAIVTVVPAGFPWEPPVILDPGTLSPTRPIGLASGFYVGETSGMAGTYIRVPVAYQSPSGTEKPLSWRQGDFAVSYDPAVLTPVPKSGKPWVDRARGAALSVTPLDVVDNTVRFRVSSVNLSQLSSNPRMADVFFRIRDGAPDGRSTLGLAVTQVQDTYGKPVEEAAYSARGGTLTVGAAGSAPPVSFAAGNVIAPAGTVVRLPIRRLGISDPVVRSVQLRLTYNPDLLTPIRRGTDAGAPVWLDRALGVSLSSQVLEDDPSGALTLLLRSLPATGEALAEVLFRVNSLASGSIPVRVDASNALDSNAVPVQPDLYGGRDGSVAGGGAPPTLAALFSVGPVSGPPGSIFRLPLRLEGDAPLKLRHATLTLTYDPNVLSLVRVPTLTQVPPPRIEPSQGAQYSLRTQEDPNRPGMLRLVLTSLVHSTPDVLQVLFRANPEASGSTSVGLQVEECKDSNTVLIAPDLVGARDGVVTFGGEAVPPPVLFSIDDVDAKAGEVVVVPLRLKLAPEAPAFRKVGLRVACDPTFLALARNPSNASPKAGLSPGAAGTLSVTEDSPSAGLLSVALTGPVPSGDALLDLEFQVSAEATGSSRLGLTVASLTDSSARPLVPDSYGARHGSVLVSGSAQPSGALLTLSDGVGLPGDTLNLVLGVTRDATSVTGASLGLDYTTASPGSAPPLEVVRNGLVATGLLEGGIAIANVETPGKAVLALAYAAATAPAGPGEIGRLSVAIPQGAPIGAVHTLKVTGSLLDGQQVEVPIPPVTATVTVRSPKPPVVKGDVTGDQKTTVADAIVALRFVVGLLSPPPTPEQLEAADVMPPAREPGGPVGDGKVTVADAIRILMMAVGLVTP